MVSPQTSTGVGGRLTALIAVVLCAAGAALALLLFLRHVGAAPRQVDAGYFAFGTAVAILIALCARWLAAGRDFRLLAAPSIYRGLALSTDTISAAFFLSLAGIVYAWGHDGLAFVVGLGAGYVLLQLLIAPLLPLTGARSISEFFVLRYGRFAALLAAVVIIISMGLLLIAQLTVAGLVGARLLGIEFAQAVGIAGAAVFFCFAVRGMTATAWIRAALFLMMLAAFLAPAVLISLERFEIAIPQAAYGDALGQIRALEETLLERELADPAVMTPMLTPFHTLSPLNFLGVVLGLAAGIASLPNVLSRHVVVPPARAVRWSAVWALLFAAVFLTAAPALAAYAKLSILTLVADRTELADLPGWVFTYGRLGLVEICGRAAIDPSTVARACASLADASDVLRLQDLVLQPDMIALAAPEIAGLEHALFGCLAAAILAAALVTADGPLFSLINALGWDASRGGSGRTGVYAIAAAALLLAGYGASMRPAPVYVLAAWALALAAGALFPAIVAGLWWRRASAPAAVVAILAGLGVSGYYLVGTQYFAVSFFETWPSLSNAGPYAREVFGELRQDWAAAQAGPPKAAAWAALDAHARGIADWWGIRPMAVALLSIPAGLAGLIVVSLILPRRRLAETGS